ncbi:hypothetical protein P4B35_21560 [Pontiellaceae bacterium B12227]|nr:hypothetical protein [Pontiellaceae bacterium B12227]
MPKYNSWAEELRLTGLNANPTMDLDDDGMTNLEEFLTGHNPTNSLSVFAVSSFQTLETDGENMVVEWESKPDRLYSITQSADLSEEAPDVIAENLEYPVNSHTVDVSQAESGFIQVNVRLK